MSKRDTFGLTQRERAFVEAYLGDAQGNATRAAELAGYGSARQRGSEVQRRPHVAAELARRQQAAAERTDITRDAVLFRLWEIGSATAEQLAELAQKGLVRVSVGDQVAALKQLSKMQGFDAPVRVEVDDVETKRARLREAVDEKIAAAQGGKQG